MLTLMMPEIQRNNMPWDHKDMLGKFRRIKKCGLADRSQPEEKPEHDPDQAYAHASNLVTGMHRSCITLLRSR